MAGKGALRRPPCSCSSNTCNTSYKGCQNRHALPAFPSIRSFVRSCGAGRDDGDDPQMPIAYVRASVVNGGSAMRIWAADQMIDAAMADAEILFARSFAGSANAYAAMASELMARRKAKAAASGKGRKGFSAGSEAPKQATVEESVAAGVEFVKAAQIAAVAADAALVTAIDEVGKAVRAAVGVAGALHAARLRTPPRAESSGSVAGLLHDFAVTEAALKGSENSNQVARQGLAAWEKAQVLEAAHGIFIYFFGGEEFRFVFFAFSNVEKPRLFFQCYISWEFFANH